MPIETCLFLNIGPKNPQRWQTHCLVTITIKTTRLATFERKQKVRFKVLFIYSQTAFNRCEEHFKRLEPTQGQTKQRANKKIEPTYTDNHFSKLMQFLSSYLCLRLTTYPVYKLGIITSVLRNLIKQFKTNYSSKLSNNGYNIEMEDVFFLL